jgi:DNA-binding LacI/PurR family transcriptional regulator
VAELLKQRIKSGVYKTGGQLPSLRELAQELNVSLPAAQRAVQRLEAEGILEAQHGVGIKIHKNANVRDTALLFAFVQPYFSRFSLALQGYMEEALDHRSNLCVMKSSHNDPKRERREIERLLANGVNGLLVWPVDDDANGPFLREIAGQYPLVLLDRTLPGTMTPAVVMDYAGAAHQVVRLMHRHARQRVLVVCDPVNISSFNQLKEGLREEAAAQNMTKALTFLDYPLIELIESTYNADYRRADACYKKMQKLLAEENYDAVFCPQSEFFDLVFADASRTDILAGKKLYTMRIPDGPPHSRRYFELDINEWIVDTSQMLVRGLDLLQDMTLQRRKWRRVTKIPIRRK